MRFGVIISTHLCHIISVVKMGHFCNRNAMLGRLPNAVPGVGRPLKPRAWGFATPDKCF